MKIRVIQSGKNQAKQWQSREVASSKGLKPDFTVSTEKKYQEMIGFGGAFTEAAAYTLSRMPKEKREKVLESYFSRDNGLAYSIGRVAIHSCDFALGNYTYVDENDVSLKSFTLEHETKWLFPVIKEAEKIRGDKIALLASPWSPPAWMKDSGEMNHGGKLLEEHRQNWANYITRYIKEMRSEGFDLWAVTVQNEPAAVQTWDSCIYSGEEERDFVKNNLGPTLEDEGLKDVKILIWDHNRDIMVERAKAVLDDPEAAKYVWGVGFHWYVSEAFENVGKTHELFPDKHLLFTEGCQEGGVHLGSWLTGERYARNMIGDFNNWCEGYLDWNIVLDETGGPNHVNNLCDAPIIADTQEKILHFNSSYYYIGHFSRYVQPGAYRIETKSVLNGEKESLQIVSFQNPDGSIVSILLNESEEDINYSSEINGVAFSETIPAHSIQTVIMEGVDD